MTAYEMGWNAAEDGKASRTCPFGKASGEAIAWRNGYRDMLASIGFGRVER
jgi:ribosome modulation factor